MFTGIIQKLGTVAQAEPIQTAAGRATRLRVSTGYADLEEGESVAVNGVCLTAVRPEAGGDTDFFVSDETLSRTNLGFLHAGSVANLERAVTLSTRLSGHLVQGHVDGLGRLAEAAPFAGGRLLTVEIPAKLARYCVVKGSIALNGVSLTINALAPRPERDAVAVSITLIPHTWENTQFSRAQAGDSVNVEVDVLAKYVESLTGGLKHV